MMRRVACVVVFLLVCPAAFSQHFHHRVSLAAGADSPCKSPTLETRLNEMQMVNWPVSHAANAEGDEAQRYFNQGMTEYYGFNYEAAMRSFRKAKSLDPSMAMAPWGIALATGPNINLGMDDECREVGLQESACAVDLAKNAPDLEKGLTAALALRYAGPLTETVAYGVAMRDVWDRTKGSTKGADVANVGALYAESLLDMRPWGLYDAAYRPALDTDTINTVLNTAMGAEKDTIGANHLYIHAIEASRFPMCGLASAEVLERRTHDGELQKEAPGHLVHMPSHIYLRLGDYAKAIAINAEAVEADRCQYAAACGVGRPTDKCPARDFCPRLYYGHYLSHNLFFPAVSATFIGRSKVAMDWAIQTHDHAALFVGGEPGLQRYMTAPLMTLVMNQKWSEIIQQKESPPTCPDGCHILTSMYHWALGMAYAATPGAGNVELASEQYDLMVKQMDAVQTEGPKGWGNNSAAAVLAVAQSTLQAHYTWAGGQCAAYTACLNKPTKVDCKAFDCTHPPGGTVRDCPQTDVQAIEHLKLAVTHEDALVYDEPPQWFPPAREALGGAYLRMAQRAQGHPDDVPTSLTWYARAKIVFEEELARHPGSGRALYGKMRALAKDREFTAQEKKDFCKTWGSADYAMSEERLWPKGDLQVKDYEVRCDTTNAIQPPPHPRNTPACACDARKCPRPGAVVIRFINDDGQHYVIGTTSKAPYAPVVLRHLNGTGDDLTQWMLDPDTGAIILASTFDTTKPLALTISPGKNGKIENKTSLRIELFKADDENQSWNWLSATPRILSTSNPGFAIDNLACKLKDMNPIVLYNTRGECQKWRVSEAALEDGASAQ